MSEMDDFAGAGFKLLHINAQSLFPKLGELQVMIGQVAPDVLCVTETWLSSVIPSGLISLDNYISVRYDRVIHKRGGGLITYFSESIAAGVDADKYRNSWRSNTDIEAQVFELKVRNIKKTILINVYRPPAGSTDNFIAYLTEILQSVQKLHEYEIYILGDMNLPYNKDQSPSYRKLKVFEAQFGLRQLITVPTRFDVKSANMQSSGRMGF